MPLLSFLAETALLLGMYFVVGIFLYTVLLQKPQAQRGLFFAFSAFSFGHLFVSWVAYYAGAASGISVSKSMLTAISAIVVLGSLPFARRNLDLFRALKLQRGDFWKGFGLAFVGLVYFQNFPYDQVVSAFCLKENIRLLLDPPEPGFLLRTIVGDQREGAPAFVAGVMGLFSDHLLGAKACYAIIGAMIFSFTYGTLEHLVRKEWTAAVAALFAALHPFLFRMPGLDENSISLAVTSLLLYLLVQKQSFASFAGFSLAYAVSVRHEGVLFLPAICWIVLKEKGPKPLLSLFGGFFLGLFPLFFRHLLAMGSPLAYEAFLSISDAEGHYSQWTDLLNFPFFDAVVRTPHNPYPGFLLHPLNLVHYSGILLSALYIIGCFASIKYAHKTFSLFLLAFVAPGLVLFMLLENWDYPSKWSIPVVLLNGPFLWLGLGLDHIFTQAKPLRGFWLLVIVGACVFAFSKGIGAIPTTLFPQDPRYLARFQCARPERPEVIELRRNELLEVPLLPFRAWISLLENMIEPPAANAEWTWTKGGPWYGPRVREWLKSQSKPKDGFGVEVIVDLEADPALPLNVVRVTGHRCTLDQASSEKRVESSVSSDAGLVRAEVSWWPWASLLWVKISPCRPNRVETFCYSCDPKVRFEQDHALSKELAGSPITLCLPTQFFLAFSEALNEWTDLEIRTDALVTKDGLFLLGQTIPVRN